MKRAIVVVLEIILYLFVYAVGSVLPGMNKMPEWTVTSGSGRMFVLDGLVLMVVLFLVVLAVSAARKRLRTQWGAPVLAFVLTLLLLLATRFPFAWITPAARM